MHSLRSAACKTAIVLSFFISGAILYTVFEYALITLVSFTHVNDLPHEIEYRVWCISWLLWAIPTAWLIALVLAIIEMCGTARKKRLALYTISPFASTVLILGVAWLALWIFMLPRSTSALLKPHLVQDKRPITLWEVSHRRVDFDTSSSEAQEIMKWFAVHQTGWAFSSLSWKPSELQITAGTYAVELTDHMILLDYYEHENDVDNDPDSDIHLERRLSSDEQAFWTALTSRIGAANTVPETGAFP